MKTLHISKNLALPLDFVTKTVAILAQRRKGKTYTASVLAEEMVAVKQPFVALDPTGAWWGLRASADGKSDGLPVVILGGQHGDVPLERTGGRLVADLVVDEPGYYVIDFSLFESGEAERQFATDFAERLYRAKAQPGKDFPLHLFVDEADRFVPQQLRKGSSETNARLLGAFEAIVRRGGLRGLGTTLISQRAAVVNKNVLEMLDILIALRTLGPNDRKAIEGYIDAHGTKEEHDALMGSIGSLDIGEAWIWEPGADPSLFKRVQIRKRHTFNSSATPKPGEHRIEPRHLAAVDLKTLSDRMAATIQKAKADDPKELRKTINELTGQIKKLESAKPAPEPKVQTETKVVEKKFVIVKEVKRLEVLIQKGETLFSQYSDLTAEVEATARRLKESLEVVERVNAQELGVQPTAPKQTPIHRAPPRPAPTSSALAAPRTSAPPVSTGSPESNGELAGLHLRVINGLAELESFSVTAPNRNQLGFYLGKNFNSGYGSRTVGELKTWGLVDYSQPGCVSLTDTGRARAQNFDPPTSRDEFHDRIRKHLAGLHLTVFDYLIPLYPNGVHRKKMGEDLDKNFESGYGSRTVGELKTAGLIKYPSSGQVQISELLFPPDLM